MLVFINTGRDKCRSLSQQCWWRFSWQHPVGRWRDSICEQ